MVIENRSLNTRPLFIDSLTEIFNYYKPKFTCNFSYKFVSTAGISNGNQYFLSVLVCNDVKIIATQLLFNHHRGRIFLYQRRRRRKLDDDFFAVINFYVISLGDKEMRMIVLLGTEVVFCRVFVSKFCKSFSVELSFGFFVLKEKDKEKS